MEKKDTTGRKRKKKVTFQSVVRRIVVGRSIKAGIEGSLKANILMNADLPQDLEHDVAMQIECSKPTKRHSSGRLKGLNDSFYHGISTIILLVTRAGTQSWLWLGTFGQLYCKKAPSKKAPFIKAPLYEGSLYETI